MIDVSVSDIVQAYAKIQSYIRKTPLFKSVEMSEEVDCEAWFKMDSMQAIGAYKIRGALNNILSMTDEELARLRFTWVSPEDEVLVMDELKKRGLAL